MEEYTYITDDIEIKIEADPDDGFVTAFADDDEVGLFSYDVREVPDSYNRIRMVYELTSMHITSGYRRHGIGREMIRAGENAFGHGSIKYPKMGNSRHENHLSHEGADLLQSCASDGIIDWEPYGD